MAKAIAVLWKDSKKDGTYPIYFKVVKSGIRKYISSGYSVMQNEWNEDMGLVNKKHPKAAIINKQLMEKLEEMNQAIDELKHSGSYFEADDILSKVDSLRRKAFFDFAQEHLSRYKEVGTFKEKKSRIKSLKVYAPNLTWMQITPTWIKNYEIYLKEEKGNGRNTINKHLEFVRALITEAREDHILPRDFDPFLGKRFRYRQPNKPALTKEEFIALRNVETKSGTWEYFAQKIFVFQVNMWGMRIGDVVRLKKTNRVGEKLCYTAHKSMNNANPDYFEISITPEAIEILDLLHDPSTPFLFPFVKEEMNENKLYNRISTVTVLLNRYIKRVALAAGIEKTITTHTARHTWTRLMDDISNGNLRLIAAGLGHETIRTTEGYAGRKDFSLIDSMNWKLQDN